MRFSEKDIKRLSYKQRAKIIRFVLKRKCRTLRVRLGRGTAYGCIEIRGSGKDGELTENERKALEWFGIGFGKYGTVILFDETAYWVKRAVELDPEAEALLIAELIKT